MTREARAFRCPENILGWIPWYADGGLSAQQKGQVEAHAAECSDCRAELDIVSGAPFEIDMELPDPDRLFREITQRIEAGERDTLPRAETVVPIHGQPRLADDELDQIGRWVLDASMDEADEAQDGALATSARPRVVRGPWSTGRTDFLAAAAALAIFFLGGIGGALFSSLGASPESGRLASVAGGSSSLREDHVVGRAAGDGDGERIPASEDSVYHPATIASGTTTTADAAPMLDVVFLDSVSLRDVSEALRGVEVEIVSGPTSLGVYRVRLMSGREDGRRPTAADVAAVANRLKASGSAVAIFAEAVP